MKNIQNDVEFASWVSKAKSGEKAKYYGGLLMKDRQHHFANTSYTGKTPPALAAAAIAWRAYMDGLVHLVQKKNDSFDYDYIAVKA